MSSTALAPPAARRSRGGTIRFGRGHLLFVGLLAIAVLAWRFVAAPLPGRQVDSAAIEGLWGIRVTQVGVTADGGLIDVRYQVVDTDKATDFLDSVENLPVLIAEDSGAVIRSAAMMTSGHHNVYAGRTYFLLYRNTAGAIQSGSSVSVAFDELRLEHVIAK